MQRILFLLRHGDMTLHYWGEIGRIMRQMTDLELCACVYVCVRMCASEISENST